VDLEVAKVIERIRVKDIKVQLDTTAVEFLIEAKHIGDDVDIVRGVVSKRLPMT
jgi:hypothetical protein